MSGDEDPRLVALIVRGWPEQDGPEHERAIQAARAVLEQHRVSVVQCLDAIGRELDCAPALDDDAHVLAAWGEADAAALAALGLDDDATTTDGDLIYLAAVVCGRVI